uniref:Metalloendopeptidase n=1 Tax=Lepeophtheirus salmonis TaxID=72036 RepID=A0A0K2TKZ8_LEPSM
MMLSSKILIFIAVQISSWTCLPLSGDNGNDSNPYEDCEVEENENIFFRNGISGDSYFLWSDKRIPYTIDPSFNSTNMDNIVESIKYFNDIFSSCIQFQPKSDSDYTYVQIKNTGSCTSRIGRAYWPFPVSQDINIGRCAPSIGHIKHELMHTVGFYHEHSRSDRDMYVDIQWDNILDSRIIQFGTNRFTSGYGEEYDYDSIMHYSARAFSKNFRNRDILTIVPKKSGVSPEDIGRKNTYSEKDIIKVKKMYRCPPYENWKSRCSQNEECGLNEYCSISISSPLNGECRTILPDGSVCFRDEDCVNSCYAGVCTSCTQDSQCPSTQYCSNKYTPLLAKSCSNYCGSLCLLSSQCGGECTTCSWAFTCQ